MLKVSPGIYIAVVIQYVSGSEGRVHFGIEAEAFTVIIHSHWGIVESVNHYGNENSAIIAESISKSISA